MTATEAPSTPELFDSEGKPTAALMGKLLAAGYVCTEAAQLNPSTLSIRTSCWKVVADTVTSHVNVSLTMPVESLTPEQAEYLASTILTSAILTSAFARN